MRSSCGGGRPFLRSALRLSIGTQALQPRFFIAAASNSGGGYSHEEAAFRTAGSLFIFGGP
jgi:hypothetical protein